MCTRVCVCMLGEAWVRGYSMHMCVCTCVLGEAWVQGYSMHMCVCACMCLGRPGYEAIA